MFPVWECFVLQNYLLLKIVFFPLKYLLIKKYFRTFVAIKQLDQ